MPDPIFADPRLAEIYDLLDGPRTDLDVYLAMADELGAESVLDVGCGTGTFACLLAERGVTVHAVDPAAASLDVAQRKVGADGVTWHLGTVRDVPPVSVDLATMTGNVAQVFLTNEEWSDALRSVSALLRPDGWLVFESRDPSKRAWERWTRAESLRRTELPDGSTVESWVDVLDVSLPLVSFRWTHSFDRDGTVLTSDSTIRFRSETELTESLRDAGLTVREVRGAPDRPGLEHVFMAQRPPDPGAWYRPGRIHIEQYDERWPQQYREAASQIADTLGDDLVAIEHVGSTAVPGMPAKPVIDILAAVRTWDRFDDMVIRLRDIGYVHTPESEEEDPGRRVFRKGPVDMSRLRTHHLHVTEPGSPYWKRIVVFRDRLRADAALAAAYVELKRRLAETFEHDSRRYTEGKSAFVRAVSGQQEA